jgi:hypothetical protein
MAIFEEILEVAPNSKEFKAEIIKDSEVCIVLSEMAD